MIDSSSSPTMSAAASSPVRRAGDTVILLSRRVFFGRGNVGGVCACGGATTVGDVSSNCKMRRVTFRDMLRRNLVFAPRNSESLRAWDLDSSPHGAGHEKRRPPRLMSPLVVGGVGCARLSFTLALNHFSVYPSSPPLESLKHPRLVSALPEPDQFRKASLT